jgi:hypothetical protein
MPDQRYMTVDGLHVTLTEQRWLTHIMPRHPEVTAADVGHALTMPVRIYDHRISPMRRVYQGAPRQTGFFHGHMPLVVVAITGPITGTVVTTFLTTLPYRGVPRWP